MSSLVCNMACGICNSPRWIIVTRQFDLLISALFRAENRVPNFYNAGLNPNPRSHLLSASPHEANLLGSAACQALAHNSSKLGACPCELRF